MSVRMYFGSKTNHKKGRFSKMGRKQVYSKKKKWQHVDEEINTLTERYEKIESVKIKSFEDFPLSKKTLKGLKACKYDTPTDIQRESIGLCLQGQDILGAAKTGSGKTLAFIVPVLECLFKNKWSQLDGLGALIISPTRELAYQTFEVLRKVGKFHDFSAGLVIGGKPLLEEAGRINRTNIVICTPGRLLQHMDETSYFSADSLKILVLDEADRILDMGFAQTMNGIIENLPSERQTLLFSATQTRSVKDLARLSLKEPVFVSVHEHATESTPVRLQQSYVVCELHEKLNLLWSFLKNHQKSKILVFLASCKEVKYIYEAFKKLQPGIPVLALHGGMPQLKRVATYNQFIWKQNAVLFATDIASRGLDFPAVNWVLQLDCPEDASTYIHRVGRTARYEKDGEALLVLLPSEEEGMMEQLKTRKIPISKIQINQKRLLSVQGKLESNCAAYPELKETAQKAFVSYLRSVFLMGNKKVFNVQSLDMEQFSRSLGLAIPPKVRFLKKYMKDMELKAEKTKAQESLSDRKTTKINNSKSSQLLSGSEDDHKSNVEDNDNTVKLEKQNKITKLKELNRSDSQPILRNMENDSNFLSENSAEDSSDESDSEGNTVASDIKSRNSTVENSSDESDTCISRGETSKPLSLNGVKTNVTKQNSRYAVVDSGSEISSSESESESSEEDSDTKLTSNKVKVSREHIGKSEIRSSIYKETSEAMEAASASESDESQSENEEDQSKTEAEKVAVKGSEGGFKFDIDDDQEELFSVKKNVDLKEYGKLIATQGENPQENKKKGKKQQTKAAIAKKLKRKNMQVNTKVSFDEEGEAVVDRLKAPTADVNTERSDEKGGIDIERAKMRMKQEDTVDREIYRQKIKQRHREERLKRREEKRKKKRDIEADEEAMLENASDEAADPTSFIPDPDEIYGKQETSDEDSESDGVPTKKRQKKMKTERPRKRDYDSFSCTENTLAEDEDFALRLLNR